MIRRWACIGMAAALSAVGLWLVVFAAGAAGVAKAPRDMVFDPSFPGYTNALIEVRDAAGGLWPHLMGAVFVERSVFNESGGSPVFAVALKNQAVAQASDDQSRRLLGDLFSSTGEGRSFRIVVPEVVVRFESAGPAQEVAGAQVVPVKGLLTVNGIEVAVDGVCRVQKLVGLPRHWQPDPKPGDGPKAPELGDAIGDDPELDDPLLAALQEDVVQKAEPEKSGLYGVRLVAEFTCPAGALGVRTHAEKTALVRVTCDGRLSR